MNSLKDPRKISLVTFHSSFSHSSLALTSIKAYCFEESYYPQISIHESLTNRKIDSLINEIVRIAPKIIGFSTYLWNIQLSLRVGDILKKLLPSSVIVFGGPEAGPRGEELLSNHPWLDYVIDGEGEVAFRNLANHIFENGVSLGEIGGLIRRDCFNNVVASSPQTFPLESLISPFKQNLITGEKRLVYLETSRGCPFRCRFCTSADDKPRTFSIERIKNDLELISSMDSKVVKLLDRSFHLGSKRTLRLLDLFLKTKDSLRFHLELNPDNISEEVIERFGSAPDGRFQFEIGLQTTHESTLKLIDRRMDINKALENIRRLMKLNKHHVHLDLIVGLPGETPEMIHASINRVFKLYPHHLQLGILKLLPGTGLLDQAESMGYLWDQQPPYEVLQNPQLSYRDLTLFKAFAELLERLWNSDLLTNTIRWLVENLCDGKVSRFFDELLEFCNFEIIDRSLQQDQIFSLIIDFFISNNWLEGDPTLKELLVWDYLKNLTVSNKSHKLVRSFILEEKTIKESGKKRLPVIELGLKSCAFINRNRKEPLIPGRYALWLKTFEKTRPLSVYKIC